MSAFFGLWRHYAPGGRRRLAVRVGCLFFFPVITLLVWMVQGMIWVGLSALILTAALILAAIGGGFTRPAPVVARDPALGGQVLVTPDRKWMSFDGGEHYMSTAKSPPPPAPSPFPAPPPAPPALPA
jgi:hypothetical protein